MEKKLIPDKDFRISSSCGLAGIMSEEGKNFSGEAIIKSIATMHERSNGLGGGFAGYGIYPQFKDLWCFHLLYDNDEAKRITEEYLNLYYEIEDDEAIPTRKVANVQPRHILWRYFLKPRIVRMKSTDCAEETEEDFVVKTVMYINKQIDGAFVVSSGKNMGIFKGVGYPENIGKFYRLEEYGGYIWTAHGRFPTNTVGWWGGAHPFGILDWSVVHNGEISSYGINRRYLLNFGYDCTLYTDTEVMAYLFDLLHRKHNLDFEIVAKILAGPFWDEIERMPEEEKGFFQALRIIYGSALVNGPFSVIVANSKTMVGLNDRIKLRPLVAARKNNFLYLASEESAIREICPSPDKIWAPKAGEPVIGSLKYKITTNDISD